MGNFETERVREVTGTDQLTHALAAGLVCINVNLAKQIETERVREVTSTDQLAHALAAGLARINDHLT